MCLYLCTGTRQQQINRFFNGKTSRIVYKWYKMIETDFDERFASPVTVHHLETKNGIAYSDRESVKLHPDEITAGCVNHGIHVCRTKVQALAYQREWPQYFGKNCRLIPCRVYAKDFVAMQTKSNESLQSWLKNTIQQAVFMKITPLFTKEEKKRFQIEKKK